MLDAVARTILRPSVGAALATKAYSHVIGADLEIPALVKALSEQCKAASSGDLSRAEALLTVQAHTLDAIFNRLATPCRRQRRPLPRNGGTVFEARAAGTEPMPGNGRNTGGHQESACGHCPTGEHFQRAATGKQPF